jgi:hypothetical protein
MIKALSPVLFGALVVLSAASASAMEDRPYTEGPVTELSFIKIKPGMFDAYMKWVATERKQLLDEEKKAGIIIDSKIYVSQARTPADADLVLAVTFQNMAALDGLDAREDAIMEKVFGSEQKSNAAAIDREKMREVLGTQLVRELVLK